MKDAVETMEISKLMEGKSAKEEYIHQAFTNPQCVVVAPGSPMLTDSNGNPWCATYVSANAELRWTFSLIWLMSVVPNRI